MFLRVFKILVMLHLLCSCTFVGRSPSPVEQNRANAYGYGATEVKKVLPTNTTNPLTLDPSIAAASIAQIVLLKPPSVVTVDLNTLTISVPGCTAGVIDSFELGVSMTAGPYSEYREIHQILPFVDYNNDSVINELDFDIFREHFNQTTPPGNPFDLNCSGQVDSADFILFRKAWGFFLSLQ